MSKNACGTELGILKNTTSLAYCLRNRFSGCRHALRDYGGGDRRSKVAPIRTQDIEQMLEQRGNGNDTPMAHVAEAGVAKPANARPTAVAKRSRSPYSTA